jgi:hypothetical protein
MAKTRRNRSCRGGGGNEGSMKIGGKSRRRRGGQYEPAPATATTNASNLLGDIGSGAKVALDKTKEGFSWALNKVFPGAVTPNPPVQPYALGGRRKRRGGTPAGYPDANAGAVPMSVNGTVTGGTRRKHRGGQPMGYDDSFKSVPASINAVGGSRRKRRGGQVVGFDENWKEYGSVGGSKRRKRKY